MKRPASIVTGTALTLLMATSPLYAAPFPGSPISKSRSDVASGFVLKVQATCAEGDNAQTCAQEQTSPAATQPEQQAPEPVIEQPQAPVEEMIPAPVEAAPAITEPEVQQKDIQQPAVAQERPKKREKRQREQQAEPAQQVEPAQQQLEVNPEQGVTKTPDSDQPVAPKADPEIKQQQQPEQGTEIQPAPKQKSQPKAEKASKKNNKKQSSDAVEQPPEGEVKPILPTDDKTPVPESKTPLPTEQAPVPTSPVPTSPEATPIPSPAPAQDEPTVAPKADEPVTAPEAAEPAKPAIEAPNDGKEAPLFDSQKNTQRPVRDNGRDKANNRPSKQRPVAAEQLTPPTDDQSAQEAISPEKLAPVTEEKGRRKNKAPEFSLQERPKGADVVKEIGNRTIIQFNNQMIVESDDRARLRSGARDVYYEDLPRGRTREIIVRKNGSQVVTIRNRNGDIIQRSRITPDGREYVLSYVDENHYEDMREWRDPGDDLPPIEIDIPRDDYILDSAAVRNPERYYEFLEQPPVERVQRLYSVDEVKRSSRVRDIARRIDLDTLNFEFGSASIAQGEVGKLQGVADAMEKLLTRNPAETFLIEGHTDAVGTDIANLALSDRRAEAVADALTDIFGIPPENLATQGYGEQYLKVRTQVPERENRRVAIRRITALVAPMARSK